MVGQHSLLLFLSSSLFYFFSLLNYPYVPYLFSASCLLLSSSQNVTKGARHKIALSIQKLRERQSVLKSLEKVRPWYPHLQVPVVWASRRLWIHLVGSCNLTSAGPGHGQLDSRDLEQVVIKGLTCCCLRGSLPPSPCLPSLSWFVIPECLHPLSVDLSG